MTQQAKLDEICSKAASYILYSKIDRIDLYGQAKDSICKIIQIACEQWAKKENEQLRAETEQLRAKVEQLRNSVEMAQHYFKKKNARTLYELISMPTPYDKALSNLPPKEKK